MTCDMICKVVLEKGHRGGTGVDGQQTPAKLVARTTESGA